jgi:hypothetical protein
MRETRGFPFCAALVLGVVAGLVAGCGSDAPKVEYADVTGKISYKGEPLKMGTVTFQPRSGASATGEIQADGTYSLKGVIGPNKVMVASREAEPGPSADPESRKAAAARGPPKNFIPPEYETPNSKLTFEVKPGANKADFDLE